MEGSLSALKPSGRLDVFLQNKEQLTKPKLKSIQKYKLLSETVETEHNSMIDKRKRKTKGRKKDEEKTSLQGLFGASYDTSVQENR